MSKRNSDGDVLANKTNLALAKSQRLLDSLLGPKTETDVNNAKLRDEREDQEFELKHSSSEISGVGAKTLKEIENGTFGRRTLGTDDKLLEALLGPKAARAHKAARQAPKGIGKPQKTSKPQRSSKVEDSEDEEEGRTAAFRSNRRNSTKNSGTASDVGAIEAAHEVVRTEPSLIEHNTPTTIIAEKTEMGHSEAEAGKTKSVISEPYQQKSKPKSFLDEILAERSLKKKKKKRKKNKTDD